jgi:hypothetical protein
VIKLFPNPLRREDKNQAGEILSIQWPAHGHGRMRKVVRRSNARSTYKYASQKVGRMVHCESRVEKSCFQYLEQQDPVSSYTEQPCLITYSLELDGESHQHIPDVLVHFSDGRPSEIWEIKAEKDVAAPELLKRTLLMSRELPRWGYNYRLVSIGESRIPIAIDVVGNQGGRDGCH